jgi:hypothetical protein
MPLFFLRIKGDIVVPLHSRFCLIFDAHHRARQPALLAIFFRFFGSSLHLFTIVFIRSAQHEAPQR